MNALHECTNTGETHTKSLEFCHSYSCLIFITTDQNKKKKNRKKTPKNQSDKLLKSIQRRPIKYW